MTNLIVLFCFLPILVNGFRQVKNNLFQQKIRNSRENVLHMSIISTAASISTVASVIAFHEAGHLLAAKFQNMKVQSYNVGYGPKIISFNDTSNTEYALRAIPLGGYVAFPANAEYDEEGKVIQEFDDPDLLQNRPPLQRALVISAGVLANILLAFLLSTGVAFTSGISHPNFSNGVIVTTAPDDASPAFRAGILKNDLILKLDNKPVIGSETAVEEFVNKIRASKDIPLSVEVERSGKILELTVTPLSNGNRATIGLGIANNVKEMVTNKAGNIFDASRQGWTETSRLVRLTVGGLSRFFSTDFSMNAVGGPISVIKTGAEIGDFSMTGLLGFAAILSVNLAVLNSLPIPALDGGQLVFVLLELAKGSPLPKKAVENVTRVGFSLVFALGITTFLGDVSKLGDRNILPVDIVDSMNAEKTKSNSK